MTAYDVFRLPQTISKSKKYKFVCISLLIYLPITRKRSKRSNELAEELPPICLPNHDGVISLCAFPNGTASRLACLFYTVPLMLLNTEAVNTNFEVFNLIQLEIKPVDIAPEVDVLITRPSELLMKPLNAESCLDNFALRM